VAPRPDDETDNMPRCGGLDRASRSWPSIVAALRVVLAVARRLSEGRNTARRPHEQLKRNGGYAGWKSQFMRRAPTAAGFTLTQGDPRKRELVEESWRYLTGTGIPLMPSHALGNVTHARVSISAQPSCTISLIFTAPGKPMGCRIQLTTFWYARAIQEWARPTSS